MTMFTVDQEVNVLEPVQGDSVVEDSGCMTKLEGRIDERAHDRNVAADQATWISPKVPSTPLEFSAPSSKGREAAPSGPPIPLGQIPNVNFLITNKFSGKDAILKTIHTLLFWRPGTHLKVKQSLRQWAGVPPDESPAVAAARRQRMQQRLLRLKMEELKQVCTALDLPLTGTKDELVQRVVSFLEHPFIWPGRRDLVAAADRRRKRRRSKAKRQRKPEKSQRKGSVSKRGVEESSASSASTFSSAEDDSRSSAESDFVPHSSTPGREPRRVETSSAATACLPASEQASGEELVAPLRPEIARALRMLLQNAGDRLNTLTIKQLRVEVAERVGAPVADEEMVAFRQMVRSVLLSAIQRPSSRQ
ncbi:hypothetical protein F1559_000905 [Cyanidiococcus yangmingshanensis]|uniref:SAP domain-containing protein n=1 Tax=Cyanidiococcus yangmingshanensis TaxID=2690220 RepID=A0A7J7IK84_9RHOD|nr:hypothetical protein F1559_000905 [Cyanidiococcus yangmingshanensis]